MTQEQENLILDLKDALAKVKEDNERLNRVVNAQEERIKKLETKPRNPFVG